MTADELLHKYFDVLALEKLTTESYQLLQQYQVIVRNSVDRKEKLKSFALLRNLSEEVTKELTLFWMSFDFEAHQENLYDYMKDYFFIDIILQGFLSRFKNFKSSGDYNNDLIKVDEKFLLDMISLSKPVIYNNGYLIFSLVDIIDEFRLRNIYVSEEVCYKLELIFDDIKMDFIKDDSINRLKKRLSIFILQRKLMKKYFGFDEAVKESDSKIYQLLNVFREELFNSTHKIIMNFNSVKEILLLPEQDFNQVVLLWTEFFVDIQDFESLKYGVIPKSQYMINELLMIFYRNKRVLNRSLILDLLDKFRPKISGYGNTVLKYFVGLLEKFKKKNGFDAVLFNKLKYWYQQYQSGEFHKNAETRKDYAQLELRIKDLLVSFVDEAPIILPFDDKIGEHSAFYDLNKAQLHSATWPTLIKTDIDKMSVNQQQAWSQLWAYAVTADGGSPTKKWLTQGQSLVKVTESFVVKAKEWLELVLDDVKNNDVDLSNAFSEANKQAIKGFIWLCSLTECEVLATVLAGLASFGYSKAYGVGARAPAVANAALYTLGLLGAQGVVQLSKLRSKVKFKAGLKLIEKSLAEAAARQGISQDDLEELSVPLFGLNAYSKQATFGSYRVVAHLQGSKSIEEHWSNSRDGSVLKKMPASVKQDYRSEFKDWQKEITDIQDVLTGQIKRLEDSYLRKRQWRFSDWQARFIQHPLLSWLGKRLIWRFEHQGQIQHGLFLSYSLVNAQQQPLTTIADDAVVTLWHPILSTVEEVQQWRTLLTAQQIVQPIKQAYREVYFITPAEIETGDYSNRFARHILKQHHFAALCKERGWGYRLQGDFDGHNHPCQGVPAWQIGVRLELDIPEGSLTTAAGLYQYITTAAVRFSHDGKSCALIDVPPIVFSEMMRDIDLFVGVTSIGTDAATDMYADNADYIDAFSKAELSARAIVRKEVLSNIISKLAIAPRCAFDNKHLIVKGDLRTYKIHLGSSNILMEPNDQYLCIVPSSKQKEASTEGLYLPFEGDHMLSVILSKALLLAADKKIKDAGIVSQIKRV